MAFLGSVALQALRRLLLLHGGARAPHPAPPLRLLPDGPAVHARADGADLVQRLGHPRERLHPLLPPGRPAARTARSPSAWWARASSCCCPSPAPSSGRLARRRRPRPRRPGPDARPSPSSTSATSSAWPARASTASRACSPGGSRATTRALRRRRWSASSSRSRPRSCSASRASPSTTSGRGRFDPRILTDLVRAGRASAARASCTSTATPPPTSGAWPRGGSGAALVLHEHFADPRMPAYQGARRPPARPASPTARSRSAPPRATSWCASATCPAARVRLIWNGAPLDEFAPVAAEVARSAVRAQLGIAEDALVVGTVGRLSEQKGHRYLLDAAAARARRARPRRAS